MELTRAIAAFPSPFSLSGGEKTEHAWNGWRVTSDRQRAIHGYQPRIPGNNMQKPVERKKERGRGSAARVQGSPRTRYAYECKFPFGWSRPSERLFVTQSRTYTARYGTRACTHTRVRSKRSPRVRDVSDFQFLPRSLLGLVRLGRLRFPLARPLFPLARISSDLGDRVPCHDYLPPPSPGSVLLSAYRRGQSLQPAHAACRLYFSINYTTVLDVL